MGAITDGGAGHGLTTKTGAGPLTISAMSSQFKNLAIDSGAVTLLGGSLLVNSADAFVQPIRVGNATSGASLTVEAGATLDSSAGGMAAVSGTAANPAVMSVTGIGTKWLMSLQANVGNIGPGQLVIDNGAAATGIPSCSWAIWTRAVFSFKTAEAPCSQASSLGSCRWVPASPP